MARLALSFLGTPAILLDGTDVALRRGRAVALLAYLAVTHQPFTRDALATLLWPDFGAKEAYTYLRQTLWAIQKALGKEWLLTERDRVGLNFNVDLWVDVHSYRQRLQPSLATSLPRDPDHLAALLEVADLYQGDFLAGFTLEDCPEFDQWQRMEQSTLRDQQTALLTELVEHFIQEQAYAKALPYARRQLQMDELNEAAHCQLMQLYSRSGQRALALRQYQACVKLLKSEVGAPPAATTTELYQAILQDRLPPFHHEQPDPASTLRQSLTPIYNHRTPTLQPALTYSPTPPSPLPPPPSPLPTPITSFIGRERELVQINALLCDPTCRLVTLMGPGGIGKTRLALAAAERILEFRFEILDSISAIQNPKSKIQTPHFPDGVFFVPLADVAMPERLATTIAGALHFTLYRRDEEPLQQLLTYLADKKVLLVLDNFEHLLVGASIVSVLLARVPGLKVLTTSRERLNLQGEWLVEVPGLLYTQDATLDHMAEYSAVQLFVQSARRVHNSFILDEQNREAIARICGLVEGMPLALELAAAWLRVLSCQEIMTEIDQSLTILSATQRDLPERHRSMRALFDYSWSLLSQAERTVMQRLAVFRGGFRREAAQVVAEATLPLLMTLVDKSLLRSDGTGRFTMHELLRQFATEQLVQQPDAAALVYTRHLTHYLTWLQQQHHHLHRKQQKQILHDISAEMENVRAAWRYALQQQQLAPIGLALDTLADVHELCGWFHEGEAVFADAITHFQRATDDTARGLLGRLQARMGFFAQRLAKYATAKQLLQSTHVLLQVYGPLTALSHCLNSLAEIARIEGDYSEAERCLTASIALCRTHGDPLLLSRTLNSLGIVHGVRGAPAEAKRLFDESLTICEAGEDQLGIAKALNNLGIIAYFAKEYSAAQAFYQRSFAISQELGHQYDIALALSNLGLVAQKQHRYADAVAIFEDSIAVQRKIGYEMGVGSSLRNLCATLLELNQLEAATVHLQEILHLAQKIRNPPLALSGLVGMAHFYFLRNDWPTAGRLATFVHHHPAAEDEIRTKAADLLVAAQPHLASDQFNDLLGAASNGELWQVVAEVMGVMRSVVAVD